MFSKTAALFKVQLHNFGGKDYYSSVFNAICKHKIGYEILNLTFRTLNFL